MKLSEILLETKHRPWPKPTSPWVMTQSWLDLLFAHWPIPIQNLRRLIPDQLEIDTFDGNAWLGIVPFRMAGVRPRAVTALPWLSAFPELNVRTYVRSRNQQDPKPGVYFFSLEAANPVAVWIARTTFKLPYFYAAMRCQDDGKQIDYSSQRIHRKAPKANFAARYRPTGNPYLAQLGTLEHWLTERYSLYTVYKGQVHIGEIHHIPWPLQPAEAEIEVNEMAAVNGVELPATQPLLHFARRIDVAVWPLKRLRQ